MVACSTIRIGHPSLTQAAIPLRPLSALTINLERLSVPSVINRDSPGFCIALDAGSNCGLEVAGRWWLMEAPESRYKRRKLYRLGSSRQSVIMAEIFGSGERIMNPLNPLKIPPFRDSSRPYLSRLTAYKSINPPLSPSPLLLIQIRVYLYGDRRFWDFSAVGHVRRGVAESLLRGFFGIWRFIHP